MSLTSYALSYSSLWHCGASAPGESKEGSAVCCLIARRGRPPPDYPLYEDRKRAGLIGQIEKKDITTSCSPGFTFIDRKECHIDG